MASPALVQPNHYQLSGGHHHGGHLTRELHHAQWPGNPAVSARAAALQLSGRDPIALIQWQRHRDRRDTARTGCHCPDSSDR